MDLNEAIEVIKEEDAELLQRLSHDELLAEIDKSIKAAEFEERWMWTTNAKALRAVVEVTQLKNPAPISEAFGDGWRIAMATVLDAIEKELK